MEWLFLTFDKILTLFFVFMAKKNNKSWPKLLIFLIITEEIF